MASTRDGGVSGPPGSSISTRVRSVPFRRPGGDDARVCGTGIFTVQPSSVPSSERRWRTVIPQARRWPERVSQ